MSKVPELLNATTGRGWSLLNEDGTKADLNKLATEGNSNLKMISQEIRHTRYGMNVKLIKSKQSGEYSVALAVYDQSFNNLLSARTVPLDSSKKYRENVKAIQESLSSMQEEIAPSVVKKQNLMNKLTNSLLPSAVAADDDLQSALYVGALTGMIVAAVRFLSLEPYWVGSDPKIWGVFLAAGVLSAVCLGVYLINYGDAPYP